MAFQRGEKCTTLAERFQSHRPIVEAASRQRMAASRLNDRPVGTGIFGQRCAFLSTLEGHVGYQEGEIGDRPEEWLDRIHDADRERVKGDMAIHQKGLTLHFESEHRVLHKDGSFRWMLSRGVAVHDGSGNVLRMAGSQTDITEGKVSDPLTGLPNRLLFIDRVGRLVNIRSVTKTICLRFSSWILMDSR